MSGVRSGLLLVVTVVLVACGTGSATSYRTASVSSASPAAASPGVVSAAPDASSPASPIAVPSAPPVAATAAPVMVTTAPPAPAPAQQTMAHATAQMFPLVAVGDARARGTVTVTVDAGRAQVSVVAAGLPPGSVHSVHLHFGNCPSAGSHILVLGTLRADPSGSGSVVSNVNSAFVGAGHFVIVYVGPAAGPLGACANLG